MNERSGILAMTIWLIKIKCLQPIEDGLKWNGQWFAIDWKLDQYENLKIILKIAIAFQWLKRNQKMLTL
jgi:hypothetical protein